MTEPNQTWYATTAVAAPERPALTQNLDVDVCVIGAGLAGLTIAREVARRGWSVAVLEARQVAASASGRNSGFVSPGFSERIDAIVERVGLPRAKELWALSDAGVEYMRRQITESEMPGVLARDGRLSVRRIDDEQALIDHAAMLRVDFGAEVEAWPTDQVREMLRSPHYFQGLHSPKAFHIHPLNYALGLAAAAEKDGARIFENTSALSLDPAGIRKRVATPHGTVRARQHPRLASMCSGRLCISTATRSWPHSQGARSARSRCRLSSWARRCAASASARCSESPKVRRTSPQTTISRSGIAAPTTSKTRVSENSLLTGP